jgi:hypothetical protein
MIKDGASTMDKSATTIQGLEEKPQTKEGYDPDVVIGVPIMPSTTGLMPQMHQPTIGEPF